MQSRSYSFSPGSRAARATQHSRRTHARYAYRAWPSCSKRNKSIRFTPIICSVYGADKQAHTQCTKVVQFQSFTVGFYFFPLLWSYLKANVLNVSLLDKSANFNSVTFTHIDLELNNFLSLWNVFFRLRTAFSLNQLQFEKKKNKEVKNVLRGVDLNVVHPMCSLFTSDWLFFKTNEQKASQPVS